MQLTALLPVLLALAATTTAEARFVPDVAALDAQGHVPRDMPAAAARIALRAQAQAGNKAGVSRKRTYDIRTGKDGKKCKVRPSGGATPSSGGPSAVPSSGSVPPASGTPASGSAVPTGGAGTAAPSPSGGAATTSPSAAPTAPASEAPSGAPTTSPSAAATTSPSEAATTSPSAPATPATSPQPNPTVAPQSGNTPNGIKAGISSGQGYDQFAPHIGWWYDWTPNPSGHSGSPIAVPMLWGDGHLGGDQDDAQRYADFQKLSKNPPPPYIIGYEEPDCDTPGSANFNPQRGAQVWKDLVAPFGAAGSKLVSPSMCRQIDEEWLTPFQQAGGNWDITNVHVNKNSLAGAKASIDYYYNKYGKPIWVTEFACVDDAHNFTPCSDPGQQVQFLNDVVDFFQNDPRVAAYAISNGIGLGTWQLTDSSGGLTTVGNAYLNAIKKYH